MAALMARNAEWAFRAYEATRHRLPAPTFPTESRAVLNLSELADDFDLFLLDAFGVLNVGKQAVPGAVERVKALQGKGKTVMVLSNSASAPKRVLLERYRDLGFGFAAGDVLSSRELLLTALTGMKPVHLGIMLPETYGREELEHLSFDILGDDPATYGRAERFVLLGCGEWSEKRQALFEASLNTVPRPVLIGNPDIVAPRGSGLSKQAGYFAHRLAENTGTEPEFFGKPFGLVFEQALAMAGPGVDPARVLMVGDTLHTDILGGRAAGLKTALITDHGALRGLDARNAIARSGIVPDYIMPDP